MYPYKIGDIVRVNHFPYMSKTEKKRVENEGAKNKHPRFYDGDRRYGVVVGVGGKGVSAIPVVQIMSHEGKTEQEGYRLRDDEIRVPQNTHFTNKHGKRKDLYGVIKMERIEMFGVDEITAPLVKIPLRVKVDMLEQYESIVENPYYRKKLDRDSPKHKNVMYEFRESVIAEKINYLATDEGNDKFDSLRNRPLLVDEIQHLDQQGEMHVYSVKLLSREDTFTHTIATRKSPAMVANEWSEMKNGISWLREDIKYHALMKNIDQKIRPDPIPHPDKYVTLDKLEKQVALRKKKTKQHLYER